jgi:tRNA(Ile)-lysidine synthase
LVEHRDGRLLRPLLAIPRRRLTATLAARGIRWIEDPSNADPRFERSRLRLRDRTAVPDVSGDRAVRERRMAEIAVETLEIDSPDTVTFDQAVFAGIDRSQAARLLSRIVQAVGKRNYPPRRERLDRATARLFEDPNRGKSGKSQDFTLSECRLALRQGPNDRRLRWIVRPENGRKSLGKTGQPLFPAVFFACGTQGTTHLD